MNTKIFFLVLLGVTLALANPIPEAGSTAVSDPAVADKEVKNVVEDSDEDDDELEIDIPVQDETTEAPKGTFKKMTNWWKQNEAKIQKLKEKSKEVYHKLKTQWKKVKEDGKNLGKEIQEIFKAGKEAIKDIKDVFSDPKKN